MHMDIEGGDILTPQIIKRQFLPAPYIFLPAPPQFCKF